MESFLSNPGLSHIGENIFGRLDTASLAKARLVCRLWLQFIDCQKFTWRRKLVFLSAHHKSTSSPVTMRKVASDVATLVSLICEKGSIEELQILASVYEKYPKDQLESLPHTLLLNKDAVAFKAFSAHFWEWHPFTRNKDNFLHCAARSGDIDMIHYLLMNAELDVDAKNKFGATPAHLAAQNGHVEVLRVISPLMRDKNPGDNLGKTPLHLACYYGYANIVDYYMGLVRAKNPRNVLGSTPLHLAAERGHLEAFMAVAKFFPDADKNPLDDNGRTPLHYASISGHLNIIKYLAPKLRDKNPPDDKGWTPFHFAAGKGHLDIVTYFCDILKDRKPKNKHGVTPLNFAMLNQQLAVVKFLEEHHC